MNDSESKIETTFFRYVIGLYISLIPIYLTPIIAATVALILVVVGNKLINEYDEDYWWVDFDQGIETAEKYCRLNVKSFENWKKKLGDEANYEVALNEQIKDALQIDESYRKRQIRDLNLKQDINYDELSLMITHSTLWQIFIAESLGIRLQNNLNIALEPAQNKPFNNLRTKDIVQIYRWQKYKAATPKAIKRESKQVSENRRLRGNNFAYVGCSEWILIEVEPISITQIFRHTLYAVWNAIATEANFSRDWSIEQSLADTFRSFSLLDGGHILSFDNSEFQPQFPRESNPQYFSLSLLLTENAGTDLLRGSIITIIAIWIFFSIAIFLRFLRPLRKISIASRQAAVALKSEKCISELEAIGAGLPTRLVGSAEFQTLLRNLAELLKMREEWLEMHQHKFRNDLLAISLMLQNLENSDKFSNPKVREISNYVQRVRRRLYSYQSLFGNIESLTLVDLSSIIDSIANDVEDVGGQVVIDAKNQIYVLANKTALKNALENLIWNAYHHGGGYFVVRIRQISSEGKIEIVIDDDGPGIPYETLKKLTSILNQYEQGKTLAEKSHYDIESAGLLISKRIISEHGGTLSLDNRINELGNVIGLRARIILPGAKSPASVRNLN